MYYNVCLCAACLRNACCFIIELFSCHFVDLVVLLSLNWLNNIAWWQKWDGRYQTTTSRHLQFQNDRQMAWWQRHYEQFRHASGLSTESQDREINTLLYCLGDKSEDISTSMNIIKQDRATYNGVVSKFDEFFKHLL